MKLILQSHSPEVLLLQPAEETGRGSHSSLSVSEGWLPRRGQALAVVPCDRTRADGYLLAVRVLEPLGAGALE